MSPEKPKPVSDDNDFLEVAKKHQLREEEQIQLLDEYVTAILTVIDQPDGDPSIPTLDQLAQIIINSRDQFSKKED